MFLKKNNLIQNSMENQQAQTQTQQVPENLTPQQALAILVQGVQFAQSKGIYSLTDAELISKAVRVFTNQPEGEKLAESPQDEGAMTESPQDEGAMTESSQDEVMPEQDEIQMTGEPQV